MPKVVTFAFAINKRSTMVTLNPNINAAEVSVLVVDDIALNILLIEKMLKKFGFEIRKANSGAQALEAIVERQPNLVLLDIMMPGMSGYEVLEKIRADKSMQELPVVMLSALSANDDVSKAISLGANDFITKPVVMERLYNTVASQLNAHFGY